MRYISFLFVLSLYIGILLSVDNYYNLQVSQPLAQWTQEDEVSHTSIISMCLPLYLSHTHSWPIRRNGLRATWQATLEKSWSGRGTWESTIMYVFFAAAFMNIFLVFLSDHLYSFIRCNNVLWVRGAPEEDEDEMETAAWWWMEKERGRSGCGGRRV